MRRCATLSAVLLAGTSSAQIVQSDFSAGADGWTSAGNAGQPLLHLGDFVQQTDADPAEMAFRAPALFLGDLSLAYRGTVTFELLTTVRPFHPSRPALVLTGGSSGPGGAPLTLRRELPPPMTYLELRSYTVRLSENDAAWQVVGEGRAPTPDEFRDVLDALMDLLIVADTDSSAEEAVGLASVRVDRPRVRVVIAAGQSNMSGCADSRQITYDFTPRSNVLFWNQITNAYAPLTFGTSDTNCGQSPSNRPFFYGPEITIADELERLFPNDQVALIKFTKGGTSIYDNWAPPGANPALPAGGNVWNELIPELNLALGTLDAAGYQYSVEGMLWMQGESDGDQSFRANNYNQRLTAFIAAVRGYFADPELPFVLGRVQNAGQPFIATVRLAQQQVAEADPFAMWFDTDDLIRFDTFHYDEPSVIILGARFADRLRRFMDPIADIDLDGDVDIDDVHGWHLAPVDLDGNGAADESDLHRVITAVRAE
jgi:hypothetical protein